MAKGLKPLPASVAITETLLLDEDQLSIEDVVDAAAACGVTVICLDRKIADAGSVLTVGLALVMRVDRGSAWCCGR